MPLSPRCRLPLRRVVSESTAPPGRRVRLSSDGGRERDGRHGRPAARVQGAAAGSPRTAGEVCRATGCPTGKGILCDESQTFPLQVNGTDPPPEFLLRGNKLRKLVNCDEILRAEATPGIPLKVEIMHTVVCRTAAGLLPARYSSSKQGFSVPKASRSVPSCLRQLNLTARLRNWIRRLSSSSVCCNASLTAFSTSNRKGQCGKLYLPRSFFVRIRIKRSLSITFLQTLSSCAGVLILPKHSEQRCGSSRSRRLPEGKDTEGNIYRRRGRRRSGSIFPHWAHGRPA